MTQPLRVLQVLSGLGMGGAETWLMAVLRYWVQQGIGQMDFLLTGGKEEVFDAEATELGARLHYLPYGRKQLLPFMRQYRRLLAHGKYDAIHDHADYASGWHFALGAGVLPPVRVAHVHNPWLHISANYAISPSRRLAAAGGKVLVNALATHVCGTSAEILSQYGFEPGRSRQPKVEVIHCGFDINRFNAPHDLDRAAVFAEFGWPPDTKLVLVAGRLDRDLELSHPRNHKNTWLSLNIVREALSRDSTIRLIMAGDGSTRTDLIKVAESWGLADQIKLPGLRSDLPALMRAADVLLFPSAQEGLGMVAVEAQAAGLPVLASSAVPREAMVIPELFHALPLSSSLTEWAEALVLLASRPRLASSFCNALIAKSPFSIAYSSHKLESIYRSK